MNMYEIPVPSIYLNGWARSADLNVSTVESLDKNRIRCFQPTLGFLDAIDGYIYIYIWIVNSASSKSERVCFAGWNINLFGWKNGGSWEFPWVEFLSGPCLD